MDEDLIEDDWKMAEDLMEDLILRFDLKTDKDLMENGWRFEGKMDLTGRFDVKMDLIWKDWVYQ